MEINFFLPTAFPFWIPCWDNFDTIFASKSINVFHNAYRWYSWIKKCTVNSRSSSGLLPLSCMFFFFNFPYSSFIQIDSNSRLVCCVIYSEELEKLQLEFKSDIVLAIPFMQPILRKNVTTTGFTGKMYGVGYRCGYNGIKNSVWPLIYF